MAEIHYTGRQPTKLRQLKEESLTITQDEAMDLFTRARISDNPEIEKRALRGLSKFGLNKALALKSEIYLRKAIKYYEDDPDLTKSRKFINDRKNAIKHGDLFFGSIYIPWN